MKNNNCSLATCRYNQDGKCKNEDKRREALRSAGKFCVYSIWRMLFQKKKKEMTLNDCKEYFKSNPEYRYAVVCGKERKPLSSCKDMDSARDVARTHIMSCGEFPVEIVDLLYM